MAGPRKPNQTFAHGALVTDPFILKTPPGAPSPVKLDYSPNVSSNTGENIARASGWDLLSSGKVPGRPADAIVGIASGGTAGGNQGQQIGSHNFEIPGLSGVALLWGLNNAGQGQPVDSIGPEGQGLGTLALGTRKITLSASGATHLAGDLMPESKGIMTTFFTWISSAFEVAVLYKNGKSSTYSISADDRMRDTPTAGSTGKSHAVSGTDYGTFKNVGPNIRRLVALGYR
jgi:hypothetical protein